MAAVLAAAACGGEPPPPPALPALAPIATVLRLPTEGGRLTAFDPDSLLPLSWTSSIGVPALEELVGYDLDERVVWSVDRRSRLIGVDLQSGGWRAYLTGVRRAEIGPDGSVYVVDSASRLVRLRRRSPVVMPARFPTAPAGLWGAINGQAITLETDSAPAVRLISSERAGPPTPVDDGLVLPTFWGELVAVAEGRQVRLRRTSDGSVATLIELPAPPTQLAFSPSGHRLYALIGSRIVASDRFTGNRLHTIDLPGEGREFRIDASGRWAMVRAPEGDFAWVLDLSTNRRVATVATAWRPDLPLVGGSATLVVLDGEDVEALDLASAPVVRTTLIPGGGVDLWLAVPWVPPERAPVALAAAESALARQDAALLADSAGTDPAEAIWLQVSSSQNPDWANDLARQLRDAGHAATVWRPQPPDESYRVVVGPFAGREAGEEAGRRLGRPYFVVRQPPRQP